MSTFISMFTFTFIRVLVCVAVSACWQRLPVAAWGQRDGKFQALPCQLGLCCQAQKPLRLWPGRYRCGWPCQCWCLLQGQPENAHAWKAHTSVPAQARNAAGKWWGTFNSGQTMALKQSGSHPKKNGDEFSMRQDACQTARHTATSTFPRWSPVNRPCSAIGNCSNP